MPMKKIASAVSVIVTSVEAKCALMAGQKRKTRNLGGQLKDRKPLQNAWDSKENTWKPTNTGHLAVQQTSLLGEWIVLILNIKTRNAVFQPSHPFTWIVKHTQREWICDMQFTLLATCTFSTASNDVTNHVTHTKIVIKIFGNLRKECLFDSISRNPLIVFVKFVRIYR